MSTFTRRAPRASSSNGAVFGGRDFNQIGDSITAIFAGQTEPSLAFNQSHFLFLDENKNYLKTIIFSCKNINEQMPYYQIGDRLLITLTGRFEATKGLAKGKMIVQYDVQVDDSYEPTQEVLDLCDKAVSSGGESEQSSPAVAASRPPSQPKVAPAPSSPAKRVVASAQVKRDNPFS